MADQVLKVPHYSNEVDGDAGGGSPQLIAPERIGTFNLVFWTCWGGLIAAVILLFLPREVVSFSAVLGYSFGGAAIWAGLSPVLIQLSRPGTANGSRRRVRVFATTLFALALAMLVSAMVSGAVYALDGPLTAVGFETMFRYRLPLDMMAVLLILTFGRARAYLDDIHRRQSEAENLRSELVQSQLQALRAKLDPHFLFNTLNAVTELARTDPGRVQEVVSHLSDILRHTLDSESMRHEIPLETELSLLRKYFEILELRYADYLSTRIASEPELDGALVPDMILQPLAENALKHGVARASRPGWIEARATRNADRLVLTIADSGSGKNGDGTVRVSRESGGFGLRQTKERLRRLYGDAGSFTIVSTSEGVTVAEIQIPFRWRADSGR